MVAEYNAELRATAERLKPDLFFVFKGDMVQRATIDAIRAGGAISIQFYPDVSFRTHGSCLPEALPAYDWVFTTKSFGLHDMSAQLGVSNASLLHHAFDPEVHRPNDLRASDTKRLACDASFIGTHSAKKQAILSAMAASAPDVAIRVWGAQWPRQIAGLEVQGCGIMGVEYAKAIQASRVNIAILSEAREGASSGDQITARSFEIPACGAFMLHERTQEAMDHFEDGVECVFFDSAYDLAEKTRYYLAHPEERESIARAGRNKVLANHSVDDRVAVVLNKHRTLASKRIRIASP
jgi:spore maturation protein CgeB